MQGRGILLAVAVLLTLDACAQAVRLPPVRDGMVPVDRKECHLTTSMNRCEAHGDKCAWCASSILASGCFHASETPFLAARVYNCHQRDQGAATAADPCQNLDQAACDSSDACVWCKSSAVPSSCFMKEQAAHLPPAVFQCDMPTLLGYSRSVNAPTA